MKFMNGKGLFSVIALRLIEAISFFSTSRAGKCALILIFIE